MPRHSRSAPGCRAPQPSWRRRTGAPRPVSGSPRRSTTTSAMSSTVASIRMARSGGAATSPGTNAEPGPGSDRWTVCTGPASSPRTVCGRSATATVGACRSRGRVWKPETGPVSRWRLPAQIRSLASWRSTVRRTGPRSSTPIRSRHGPPRAGSFPAATSVRTTSPSCFSLPMQRAARISMRRHVVPDWVRLGAECDGVHLSWAGFLTSEGLVSHLGGADVAMLRYWFSATDPLAHRRVRRTRATGGANLRPRSRHHLLHRGRPEDRHRASAVRPRDPHDETRPLVLRPATSRPRRTVSAPAL